ncbi:MAG: RNA-guided endonuclease IscB [Oscillospiraceae bacterium]|nr:RNA-guided endonuclease IscB [Oscillospiraceae bacterium]
MIIRLNIIVEMKTEKRYGNSSVEYAEPVSIHRERNSNMVYVIDTDNKALSPCKNRTARWLLKHNKAKCVKREPFTIKLNHEGTREIPKLTLGMDTGSDKIGTAAVDDDNHIYYVSEVQVRNDIADKMKQRSKYRRSRRNRKTRYRKARWQNRKNSKRNDRFSPTMRSKIDSHIKEIRFARSILPIAEIIMETGTFDAHAMKNPEALKNKWLYQRGTNYGYANTRAYVLDRDGYICRQCSGKSKDSKLEVHHIQFRSEQGSDDVENLITLCKNCHDKVHGSTTELKLKGKAKGTLRHATQMNGIRVQLLKRVPSKETFGFVTKEHAWAMGLEKTHYNDATAIACLNNIERNGLVSYVLKTDKVLVKKCVSDGDYQQTKGVRSERRIQTGKMQGFRKFDKVRYKGTEYFIKGRMSTGYAILMDIEGNKQELKPIPKLDKMERIGARKGWIVQERRFAAIHPAT